MLLPLASDKTRFSTLPGVTSVLVIRHLGVAKYRPVSFGANGLSATARLDISCTLTAQHVEVHDAFILRSLCVHVMSLHEFVHSSVCGEVSLASENVFNMC